MENINILNIVETVQLQRNLEKNVVIETIEEAITSYIHVEYPMYKDISSVIDKNSGNIKIFSSFTVVNQTNNKDTEILISDARNYVKNNVGIGDVIKIEISNRINTRIGAQTIKNILIKKFYELEKLQKVKQYQERIGKLLYAKIINIRKDEIILELQDSNGVLPLEEKPMSEKYQIGSYLYVVLKDISTKNNFATLICSRNDKKLVEELFKKEIEEIENGIIKIRSIAREPGIKMKIAVSSDDPKIEPTGACIGIRGSRIKPIIRELREKIDIVLWDDNEEQLIKNAFKPLVPLEIIKDDQENQYFISFKSEDIALALGKKGSNIRLVGKLINKKITLTKSDDEQIDDNKIKYEFLKVPNIDEQIVINILKNNIFSLKEFALTDFELLLEITKLNEKQLNQAIEFIKKRI